MLPVVIFQDQVLVTMLADFFQNILWELVQREEIVIDGSLLRDERMKPGRPVRVC